MITYNPLLCLDFYKTCHAEQYPKGLTKMVSYYTPRMSRLSDTDKVTLFGLQAFIQEYLIEAFNDHFFNVPFDSVLKEYTRVLGATIRTKGVGEKRLRELHDLGYLPLQIRAVPEGTRTNIKVPQIEISNTHPNFVWLVNTIETMLSCTMWHTQVSAEVGYRYRKIVNEYAERTCDDSVVRARLLGDFSMRGQESVESATKSAAAFCLSFLNTATVPAILWLEHNYNCDCSKEPVACGALSTEHSVMCSNFAVDGDEVTQILIDKDIIIKAAKETGKIVTVEEHSIIGGLGSAVCDVLCENYPVPVTKIGVMDTFGHSGPAAALLEEFGLCADNIANTVKKVLGK